MLTGPLKFLALLILPAFALVAVGCDDENGAAFPLTPTPFAAESPTPPPPLPTVTATGTSVSDDLTHVNAIVNLVERGEVDELDERVELASLPCGPQQGGGSPPPCPSGAAEGTPVRAFPVTTCQGELRNEDQVRPALESITSASPRLYAVYEAPDPYLGRNIDADYVAVFNRQTPDQGELGAGIVIRDGDIVGLWFGCQAPADQIVPPGTPAVIPAVPDSRDPTPTR